MQLSLKACLITLASAPVGLATPAAAGDDFITQPGLQTTSQPKPQIQPQSSVTKNPTTAWHVISQPIAPAGHSVSVLELTPPAHVNAQKLAPPVFAGNPANTAQPTQLPAGSGQSQPSADKLVWLPSRPSSEAVKPKLVELSPPARAWQAPPAAISSFAPSAPTTTGPGLQPARRAHRSPPSQLVSRSSSLPARSNTPLKAAPTNRAQQIALTQQATATPAEIQNAARRKLAAQITKDIDSPYPKHESGVSIGPIDRPEGWANVSQRLSQHIATTESLLRRSAFYSARQESENGIRYLMQIIDQNTNTFASEPHLNLALVALNEADDFSKYRSTHANTFSITPLINSHQTTALKNKNTTGLSPLDAAAHYRIHAADQLVLASQDHPWASELFYTLGRVFQAEAESAAIGQSADLRWRATTFYRAAAAINPKNALALNQLGFIFLQLDRAADAQEALVAAIEIEASKDALANLVEASRRLGNQPLHQWAAQQHARISAQQPRLPNARPRITVVSPQQFRAISPQRAGPRPAPSLPPHRQAYRPPTPQMLR